MTFPDRGACQLLVKHFADDTKLYTVLQNDAISLVDLQNCFDAITEWQLKLAPDKCTVMHVVTLLNVLQVIILEPIACQLSRLVLTLEFLMI